MSGFGILFIDQIGDGVKGHDLLHEWSGDSSGEATDEDIMVCDASTGDVALKGQDIALEGQGELCILFDHVLGGEPGDNISGSVLMFECCLELSEEVILGF